MLLASTMEKRQLNGFPFTLIASAIAALTDTAAIAILGAPRVAGGPADPLEFLQSITSVLAREDENQKRQIYNDVINPTVLVSEITVAATGGVTLTMLGAKPVTGSRSNLLNLVPSVNSEYFPLHLLDGLSSRNMANTPL
jgi:hypothetical protein